MLHNGKVLIYDYDTLLQRNFLVPCSDIIIQTLARSTTQRTWSTSLYIGHPMTVLLSLGYRLLFAVQVCNYPTIEHPFGCGELFRWTTDTLAQRIAMKWSVFAINLIISIFERKCPEDMSGLSRTSHIIWRELPLGGYHSWSTSSSRRDKYHEKFKGNSQLADSG